MPDPKLGSTGVERFLSADEDELSQGQAIEDFDTPSSEYQARRKAQMQRSQFLSFKDTHLVGLRAAEGIATSFLNLGLATNPAVREYARLTDSEIPELPSNPISEPIFGETETIGGELLTSLAQFVIPYAGIGKAVGAASKAGSLPRHLRILDSARAASPIGRIGAEAAKGAVVDFAFFDDEANLANAFEGTPLQNVITDALSVDADDGTIERRIKGTIIGAGAGIIADAATAAISHSIKRVKAKRAGQPIPDAPDLARDLSAARLRSSNVYLQLESSNLEDFRNLTSTFGDVGPSDVGDKDWRELIYPSRKNERKAGRTIPAESDLQRARRGASINRGSETIIERLRSEGRFSRLDRFEGRAIEHTEAAEVVKTFIDRIGPDLFDDIGITFSKGTGGQFYPIESVIRIGSETLLEGRGVRTVIHELWHALERHAPDADIKSFKSLFRSEKASFLKENPQLANLLNDNVVPSLRELRDLGYPGDSGDLNELRYDIYRYVNESEFFAEKLTDISMDRLDSALRAAEGTDFQRLLEAGKRIVSNYFNATAAIFGFRRAERVADRFFSRKIPSGVPRMVGTLDASRTMLRSLDDIPEGPIESSFSGDEAAIREVFQRARTELDKATEVSELFPGFTGNPKDLSESERLALLLEREDANLRPFRDKDAATYYRVIEDIRREELESAFDAGRITFAEMDKARQEAMTRVLRQSPEQLAAWEQAQIRSAGDIQRQTIDNAIKGLHIRDLAEHKIREVRRLQDSMPSVDSMTIDELAQFDKEMDTVVGFMQASRGIGQAQGQALAVRRLGTINPRADVELRLADEINLAGATPQERIAAKGGEKKARARLKAQLAALEARGIEALDEIAKDQTRSLLSKGQALLADVWFNFILSGPMTHAVNFMSNTAFMFYRPFPRIIGGALTGQADVSVRAIRELGYLVEGWKDAFMLGRLPDGSIGFVADHMQAAKKASRGTGVLLGDAGKVEIAPSVASRFLDNTLRLPSRALQFSDELAKQITARARTKSLIRDEVTRVGREAGWSNEEIAYKIQTDMDRAFNQGVALRDQDIVNQAAREVDEASGLRPEQLSPDEAVERQTRIFEKAQELREGELGQLARFTQEGTEAALDATFTRPLRDQDGIFAKGGAIVQTARERLPFLTAVVPFVQTPTNIITQTLTHSPVDGMVAIWDAGRRLAAKAGIGDPTGYRSQFAKQITSGDPEQKADALGRLAWSVGFVTTAGYLASNWADPEATIGLVGAGPRDFRERQNWEAAGVQFNSFFYTNDDGTRTYIPFNRIEPMGTILGIVADIATASHFVDPEDKADAEKLQGTAYAAMESFAVNIGGKTYLKGVSDFLDAFIKGDAGDIERWVARTAASATVPNIIPQTRRAFDADMKQERGYLDIIQSRSGWGAETLEPKRNALGEPRKRLPSAGQDSLGRWVGIWNPFTISETSKDPVDREMARMPTSFSPPKKNPSIEGVRVDLLDERFKTASGQSAFDRWQEITRTIGGNQRLRPTLRRLVQSKEYEALSEESVDGIASQKAAEIRRIIQQYRRAALGELRKEIPEIDKFITEALGNRGPDRTSRFPDFLETQR